MKTLKVDYYPEGTIFYWYSDGKINRDYVRGVEIIYKSWLESPICIRYTLLNLYVSHDDVGKVCFTNKEDLINHIRSLCDEIN